MVSLRIGLMLLLAHASVSAQQAPTDSSVWKEVENARFCGEIVIQRYDSVNVNGPWMLDKVTAQRLDMNGVISPNFHSSLPAAATRQSHWPKAGDTCFVIIGRVNRHSIALFGFTRGDEYFFWNPYSGSPKTCAVSKSEFWKRFREYRAAGKCGC
jgi:hypothetical protein